MTNFFKENSIAIGLGECYNLHNREDFKEKKKTFKGEDKMYRGQSGMWLWILHRLTGVGILGFLFLHIADTYLIGLGSKYYNELVFLYHLPPFRVIEVLLVGAVLFHACNGLRIILLDFWESAIKYQRQLYYATLILFVITWLPAAFMMLRVVNWSNWSIEAPA